MAAEAMGINLAKHKRMAFCISSFFAGVGGGLFAMLPTRPPDLHTSMTYEILLIVVIGGIGSISEPHRLVPVRGGQRVVACGSWTRETYIGAFRCPSCGPASGWWCSPSSS